MTKALIHVSLGDFPYLNYSSFFMLKKVQACFLVPCDSKFKSPWVLPREVASATLPLQLQNIFEKEPTFIESVSINLVYCGHITTIFCWRKDRVDDNEFKNDNGKKHPIDIYKEEIQYINTHNKLSWELGIIKIYLMWI